MELCVDLGPVPADPCHGHVLPGLQALFARNELCDVRLSAGGETFLAHAAVLAAASGNFRELLVRMSNEQAAPFVVELAGVSHPESVQAMLTCIYGPQDGSAASYNPSSEGVNRDILQLAQRFQIPQLEAEASLWLAKGLNTSNVLERLCVCEEFGLSAVREKILEQLTANPGALSSWPLTLRSGRCRLSCRTCWCACCSCLDAEGIPRRSSVPPRSSRVSALRGRGLEARRGHLLPHLVVT